VSHVTLTARISSLWRRACRRRPGCHQEHAYV